MEGPDRSVWFAGDLADPWVAAIAEAVPRAREIDCPSELPESWPAEGGRPAAVVVHRSILTPADAQRLVRLRARWDRPPRLVLCVGPHARYVDVECWSRLVDVVLPEATAPQTVARHAFDRARAARPDGARPRVAVVSTNHELRVALAETCRAAGFAAEPLVDWGDLPLGIAVAWDVPVLEPDWPSRLAKRARVSAVVALLGFADRATVAKARESGASACLELPCDAEDLVEALDRATPPRPADPAHATPPAPLLAARAGRARRIVEGAGPSAGT